MCGVIMPVLLFRHGVGEVLRIRGSLLMCSLIFIVVVFQCACTPGPGFKSSDVRAMWGGKLV